MNVGARKKKVYVAGPMRGYIQSNFPAFDQASAYLRARGYEVFNPADHDRVCGLTGFETELTTEQMHAMFRWDLARVAESDMVVFLDGWKKSKGACAERTVAHYLGIPCYDMLLGYLTCEVVPQAEYSEPHIVWTEKPDVGSRG